MNTVQGLFDAIDQEKKDLEQAEALAPLLPLVEFEGSFSFCGGHLYPSIHFNIFSYTDFRAIRRAFGPALKAREPYIMDNDGRRVHPYSLKAGGKTVAQVFITVRAGRSCQRVLTGTKEVNCYELVCFNE